MPEGRPRQAPPVGALRDLRSDAGKDSRYKVAVMHPAAIDVVEAAYDLDVAVGDWLPKLNAMARPLSDHGLGFYSALLAGESTAGQHLITQLHVGTGPEDLPARFWQAAQVAGPEAVGAWSKGAVERGTASMSEMREQWPETFDVLTAHAGCKDGLSIAAVDPDAHGVAISIVSPKMLKLSRRERERWRMLAIHITAGYRLRRSLIESTGAQGMTYSEMPLDAEALLDPAKFVVSQATRGAQNKSASKVIREAAVRVDKARGKLRRSNPEEALEIWYGLVRGRWSLVDWFDTDGRRFMLARPNAPNLGDPRGLTPRELQVATYAARGESHKLIGYRFGISRPRVTSLLGSAMRKLGVKTQAQLVGRFGSMPAVPESDVEA